MISYILWVLDYASHVGGWIVAQTGRDVFGGKLLLSKFNFVAFAFVLGLIRYNHVRKHDIWTYVGKGWTP